MRVPVLAFALLLSACATYPRVHTDYDSTANFAGYRTYSWLPTEVPRGMNPLMFRRVEGSIDRALQARGYHPAAAADFAVAFTIGEQDKTDVYDYGYGGW